MTQQTTVQQPPLPLITVEGLGPWSHSKLKMLQKCPLNFYLKYIKKQKGIEGKSELALVGSAAHRIIELFVTGTSLSDAFKETQIEYSKSIPKELWSEKVESLELSISEFKRRLDDFDKKHKIKQIYTELRIGVTRDFKPTTFFAKDVFFRGILDMALHLENNDAIFLDHKKGGTAAYGLKNYTDQLNTYKVLFHHGVENISGATAGINFIEEGTLPLGEYHHREDIEIKLKNNLLFLIDAAIHNVEDIGYFKKKVGSHCEYCEYKNDCKSGQLKQIEENTKTYVQNGKRTD